MVHAVRSTGGVGMVAANRLRHGWRGVVALAVVVGVVGAIVLGVVAGARRTDTALERFRESSGAAELQITTREPTEAQLEELRSLPEVAALAELPNYQILVDGSQLPVVPAAVDERFGTDIDRAVVLEGREADPDAVDEVTIGEGFADLLGIGVGDRLEAISVTPEQVEVVIAGDFFDGPPGGPPLSIEVVGIVRRPLDLGELGGAEGLFVLPPGFHREYQDQIGVYQTHLRVRTVGGAADVERVIAEAERIFADSTFFNVVPLAEDVGAENTIDVLEAALWIFAGVAALAGLVVVSILLSRQVSQLDGEQPTLRALGLTRAQRVAVHLPAAVVVAVAGGLLAVAGAVLLSPRFPIDLARQAEPDPGVDVDPLVLGVGFVLVAVLVLVGMLVPAFRSSRRAGLDEESDDARLGAHLAAAASRSGLPPRIANGVRMAFHRGRGRSAVPVRSAVLGGVFGVLGITAGLVFAASLRATVDDPERYGWAWDVAAEDQIVNEPCGGDDRGASEIEGLEAVAELCYSENLQVDGRSVSAMAFWPLRGTVDPVVVEGRAPSGPDEIALGAATLDALDKGLGDVVEVSALGESDELEVVGQAVLPPIGFGQPLAEGAVLTGEGLEPFFDIDAYYRYFVGRYGPDTDPASVEQALEENPGLAARPAGTVPVDLDNLRKVSWVPVALAALLGALSLLAVGHAIVTSVRRRRGELAVLKTFGFTRHQVRSTVAWQATSLAVVGLALGIPLGLALGNVIWRSVAEGVGIAALPWVRGLARAVMVPAAWLAVLAVASPPARSAARPLPAEALRAD